MGIMLYHSEFLKNGTADGIMPTEDNNFLFAVNHLQEDYNNTVAIKTILHSLELYVSPFSTLSETFLELLIKLSKYINEQKVKNSPLYAHIIEKIWPLATSRVNIMFSYS
jgi:hypothetical protein